jgi:methylated-DNA-protein-cysteine methyltransferase related protein
MTQPDKQFKESVYELVAQIPAGKVMSYGDVALQCGRPLASRVVGTIAHYGPEDLPWHRVVNRFGGLASGYWGGREVHKVMLESEGIPVSDTFVIEDFEKRRWRP